MEARLTHNALLQEIASAATAMAHARSWRDGLDELLGGLGRAAAVGRVALIEIGQDEHGRLTRNCTHDWAADGSTRRAGTPRSTHDVSERDDPTVEQWIACRRRGELIRCHTRDLGGGLREDFDLQEIKSYLSMPIHVGGEWWGHLDFEDGTSERDWTDDEIHLLQTTAMLIGGLAGIDATTERHRQDIALRAAMLDVALDAIIIIDGQGNVREFNPAAAKIFRLDRALAIGRPVRDLVIPERLRAAHDAGFRAATVARRLAGPGVRHELMALRADGSEFPVELSFAQIDQGDEVLYAGFIRDLTDRRAAEQRMRAIEHERASLARFFSPQQVEYLIAAEKPFSGERYQPAVVLFVDMLGFTSFCAERSSGEVIIMLRELLALLSEQVFAHDGTIDKFLGDGLMAVFGSPHPGPRDASNAVRCASAMQHAVGQWNVRHGRVADAEIRVAIGIHAGQVILGDIGSEQRLEFAVLGDTVNIASRVESKCRSLDASLLVTGDVIAALDAEGGRDLAAGFTDHGLQALRGRHAPLHLYGIPRSQAARPDGT